MATPSNQENPRIDITFSSSSDVYDPSSNSPFEIYMKCELQGFSRPVTIHAWENVFALDWAFFDEGLSFTDAETGDDVKREAINICYFGVAPQEQIRPQNSESFHELEPGVPRTWTFQLPTTGHQKESKWQTYTAHQGLLPGRKYRVGVSPKSRRDRIWWMEGRKASILWWGFGRDAIAGPAQAKRRGYRAMPLEVTNVCEFTVKDPILEEWYFDEG